MDIWIFIDRPLGMKGYILNLTIRGEGVINNNGEQFVCRRRYIIVSAGRDSSLWTASGRQRVVSPVGLFPASRLLAGVADPPTIFAQTGFFRPDEARQPHFSELFGQIISAGQGKVAILSYWRSICWSSCCSDVWR